MALASTELRSLLREGQVIPAHPLALNASRKLDERRQRALTRYYCEAGSGGIAVGVHTTQFAIRDKGVDLYRPVLQMAADEMAHHESGSGRRLVKVAGVCGGTKQATAEAALATELGYDAGLLSLAALRDASIPELVNHCAAVAEAMPVIGFYLQPAVGGRLLDYNFWRQFAEIPNVVAIKVAAFNRYQTLDVLRAVADSGRMDIALYTGNDDNIVHDLVTNFRLSSGTVHFVGGLLGHWAVWTQKAAELLGEVKHYRRDPSVQAAPLLARAAEVTDSNAALFDVAHNFHGCIAGLHEILRRQGLLEGRWCLDPNEDLSPGQMEELDRVCRSYPHLTDDEFVQTHRDRWLN